MLISKTITQSIIVSNRINYSRWFTSAWIIM